MPFTSSEIETGRKLFTGDWQFVAAAGRGMTPPPGYFERIREICDRHEIVFIADEVVTGFGRTGKNFGIEPPQ